MQQGIQRGRAVRVSVCTGVLSLVLLLTAVSASAADQVALVIGNSDYTGSLSRLPNTVNDANDVAAELSRLGFELVTGKAVINADKADMDAALKLFRNASREARISLIYYTGHGVGLDARNIFLPVDAVIQSCEDVTAYGIGDDYVFANMRAPLRVVVADACRDNPVRNICAQTASKSAVSKGLSLVETPEGSLYVASTQWGETASDGNAARGERNSPYAAAMLAELRKLTQADTRIDDFFRSVAAEVRRKTGNLQMPEAIDKLPPTALSLAGHHLGNRAGPSTSPELRVTSNPGGAEVFIDEVKVGTTPLTDGTLAAGQTVTIRVVLPGHLPVTQRVRMGNGTMPVHVALARSPSPSSLPVVAQNPGQPVKPPESQNETDPRIRQAIGELVSIPGGSFEMGSNDYLEWERPVHSVRIRPFRLGKFEVTANQWRVYVDATGGHLPGDADWGQGDHPVSEVSWHEIQGFLQWLNANSEGGYRLPTEAEWEYAARAGSGTRFSWGDAVGRGNAHCYNCDSKWDKGTSAPVGSFPANRFGLFEMHGNVGEWTQDCWIESYVGAPRDGSAWLDGECSRRVVRSGNFNFTSHDITSSSRSSLGAEFRSNDIGFRLAQDAP